MTTWIVTGAAGFIGSNFVRSVLDRYAHHVVLVDKLTYAGRLENLDGVLDQPRVQFVQADIADAAAVQRLFADHRPEAVVNFAAETHVDRSIDGPRAFITSNLVGVFELLDAARHYYRDLQGRARNRFRFLHVSTDEVYGSLGPTGSFSEDTPYAPNSPYAASKAGADHLCRAYYHTYSVPVLITNCSNNFGPYQFPEKLIPLMILNAIEGRPLPLYGEGLNVRDWLYVTDHCEGILRVLADGRPGEKYNIGGGNERTNLEVVNAICGALESLAPARSNSALTSQGLAAYADLKRFVEDRPGHDLRYAIDAAKVRNELGWSPRRSFEDAITETVRWYLERRDWCAAVQDGGYGRERLGLSSQL